MLSPPAHSVEAEKSRRNSAVGSRKPQELSWCLRRLSATTDFAPPDPNSVAELVIKCASSPRNSLMDWRFSRGGAAQQDASLAMILRRNSLTSKACQRKFKLSARVIFEDFQALLRLGIAEWIGAGHATRYILRARQESLGNH